MRQQPSDIRKYNDEHQNKDRHGFTGRLEVGVRSLMMAEVINLELPKKDTTPSWDSRKLGFEEVGSECIVVGSKTKR